jgi:hypothetical protein
MQFNPIAPDLLSHGYSLIPVRLDKKPHWELLPKGTNGKATWKPYQERQPDANEMHRWAKASPPAYGIVTGRLSGVVTFDFDGEDGKQLAQQWGIHPHRQTGSGGLHWDVRHPGFYVPTLNGKAKEELGRRWPGLDVKGDGGYAVALGHNQSGRYEWLRDIDPDPADLVSAEIWQFLKGGTPKSSVTENLPGFVANGSHVLVPPRSVSNPVATLWRHAGATLKSPGGKPGRARLILSANTVPGTSAPNGSSFSTHHNRLRQHHPST